MDFGYKSFAQNNTLLNSKLKEKKHLIAVHRGSWAGNIIQSTIPAFICAFKMGADMVECDVNRTTDGVLYCFHDGWEKDLLHSDTSIKKMSSAEVESHLPYNTTHQQNRDPIARLSDILSWLPSDKLLNIDRAWDIFPYVLDELDKHPKSVHQIILKSAIRGKFHGVPVTDALSALQKHSVKYMYMPICYSLDDVKTALELKDINLVGCELIAGDETDELYQDEAIQFIHEHDLFTWVNAIQLGNNGHKPLYGPLDDDISLIQDPDLGWGKLFEKNIDIIQTDWPAILYSYRKEKLNI